MRYFYDTELQKLYSENDLRNQFKVARASGETEAENFEDYIDEMTDYTELIQVTLSDKEVEEISDIMVKNGGIYAIKTGDYRYSFSYENILEISEKRSLTYYDLFRLSYAIAEDITSVSDLNVDEENYSIEIFYFKEFVVTLEDELYQVRKCI